MDEKDDHYLLFRLLRHLRSSSADLHEHVLLWPYQGEDQAMARERRQEERNKLASTVGNAAEC